MEELHKVMTYVVVCLLFLDGARHRDCDAESKKLLELRDYGTNNQNSRTRRAASTSHLLGPFP